MSYDIYIEMNKIIEKMNSIQVEKRTSKYKHDSWKTCDLIELKAKLVQTVNKLFLIGSTERHLRDLIHAFNYLYFIYSRTKHGAK